MWWRTYNCVSAGKTLLDYADPIIAALKVIPMFLSISANKLGKDEEAMKSFILQTMKNV